MTKIRTKLKPGDFVVRSNLSPLIVYEIVEQTIFDHALGEGEVFAKIFGEEASFPIDFEEFRMATDREIANAVARRIKGPRLINMLSDTHDTHGLHPLYEHSYKRRFSVKGGA